MILVIGGAFQGKEEYARTYLKKEDKASWRIISHYETVIRGQYLEGKDPAKELERLLLTECDICLVADEVGRGVIPLEREERKLRDVIGKTLIKAAREATEVHRVTCGIGERIK